jgi:magnesium transporter
MHADKRAIIAKTGLHIPIRDMRLLDFNLVAVDSTILVRDNAIIASMYHVRLIVTADSVIIPRDIVERDVVAARFVDALQDSIVYWARQRREFQRQQEQEHLQPNEDTKTAEPTTKAFSSLNSPPRDGDDSCSGSVIRHEGPPLAFELVVLEAALKEVVGSMSLQIKELEGIAFPALDALTKAINTSNLERVRKVKTRHQRLILRTEALRDELQRFLQDDEDMARMCLSRRKEVEEAAKAAAESYGGEGIEGERTPSFHFAPGSLVRRSSLPFGGRQAATSSPPGGMSTLPSREYFAIGQTTLSTANYTTAPVPYSNEDELDAEAQQEVENLLESYYMQVDGLYDKLVSVEEYIKDTEEYINIGELCLVKLCMNECQSFTHISWTSQPSTS